MEMVKKFATLAVILVAAYFAFQHFAPTEEGDCAEEDIPAYALPPVPAACSDKAKNLENAIYAHQNGRASAAQLNRKHRIFISCLTDSGFSDVEIRGVVDQIKASLKGDTIKEGF